MLPADEANFYLEEGSKIINVEGLGMSRTGKQAKKIANDFNKVNKASKNAITSDLLEGNIERDEAKALIAALPVTPDYSSVVAV